MKHNILLIDDSADIRISMKKFLEDEGFFVKAVATGDEGVALVRQGIIPFSLALVDFHMPDMAGDAVTKEIKKYNDNLCVLTLSGDDSADVHTKTLDSGASFVLSKITEDIKLLGVLHRICRDVEKRTKPLTIASGSEHRKLIERVDMVGASSHLAEVANLILKCAPFQQSVLILGENGTGKEKVAQAIHRNSNRRLMPFIPVNCGAISKDLIASELFGHQKGSFTGATENKIGKFQAAQGGTIFLDEIGEMPINLQVNLLRVLQEKAIVSVGSNEPKKIDVRVIAATNAPLEQMVKEGRFREDLYYRLNGFPIHLAPLNKRPEDIPHLASLFLTQANLEIKTNKILLQSTVDELMKMPWPGNVRELQNTIVRMVTLSDEKELSPAFLRNLMNGPTACDTKSKDLDVIRFKSIADERTVLEEILKNSSNISDAARRLGMSRSTLRDKIKSHGIVINKQTHTGSEK